MCRKSDISAWIKVTGTLVFTFDTDETVYYKADDCIKSDKLSSNTLNCLGNDATSNNDIALHTPTIGSKLTDNPTTATTKESQTVVETNVSNDLVIQRSIQPSKTKTVQDGVTAHTVGNQSKQSIIANLLCESPKTLSNNKTTNIPTVSDISERRENQSVFNQTEFDSGLNQTTKMSTIFDNSTLLRHHSVLNQNTIMATISDNSKKPK